jgi:hypothetical protein
VIALLGLLIAATPTVSLGARQLAAVAILGQPNDALRSGLDDALREETSLRSQQIAPEIMAELSACPVEVRFSCWARIAPREARVLIALSEGGALMIDLDRARAAIDSPTALESVEDRVFRATAEGRAPMGDPSSTGAAWVREDWRKILEPAELYGRLSEITIASPREAEIWIDDRSIGAHRTVRLVDLAPGEHRLVAVDGKGARFERTISAVPGDGGIMELAFPAPGTHPVRTAALIVGIASLAASTGLMIAELGGGRSEIVCIAASAEHCRSLRAASSPPTFVLSSSPSPSPGVGLSVGLGAAGATWILSSIFEGEVGDAPWVGIAIGAAIGIAGGAITMAVASP